MKLWKQETQTKTHTIIRINAEEHCDMHYVGEFNDDAALKEFFLSLDEKIDIEKNCKLLNYYGYLHLFIKRHDL